MPVSQQTMTRAELLDRIATAKRNDRIRYHTGWLFEDRRNGINFAKVHSVASAALRACEEGHCYLVQERVEPGCYHYYAIKRDPPEPFKWEGCYDPSYGQYVRPKANRVGRSLARQRVHADPVDRAYLRAA